MKNLSSLTTFFITFLFVVYLGVFTGLKINGFISDKKLVNVSVSPEASVIVQPTASPVPTVKPKASPLKKTQTKTPTPSVFVAPLPEVVNTPPPVETPPPPSPSEPPASNKCIITVSGGQYDVTDFRNIHSGGDIFQCGTDMTSIFLSQHPASFLQKMSRYKI